MQNINNRRCPFNEDNISEAIEQLKNMSVVITDSSFGIESVYLKENFYAERRIAQYIKDFIKEPKGTLYKSSDINAFLECYEKDNTLTLAQAQRQAVHMALTSPISIISGGPGTGKTMTIQTIIAAIRKFTPKAKIRACAPTGKAAIRIEEMTQLKASTIHRAIGLGSFQGVMRDGELACDFMIIDEFSMTDLFLFDKLLDALCPCARLIIVVDYN